MAERRARTISENNVSIPDLTALIGVAVDDASQYTRVANIATTVSASRSACDQFAVRAVLNDSESNLRMKGI